MREISANIGIAILLAFTALLVFVLVIDPHQQEQSALRACDQAIRRNDPAVQHVQFIDYRKSQDGFTAHVMVDVGDRYEFLECNGTHSPTFVFSINKIDLSPVY